MTDIKIQTAYLIREWGDRIVTGIGFHISVSTYGSPTEKAFFREDENSSWEMVGKMEVVYTLPHAKSALVRAKDSLKNFYERQVKEYTEKLKSLTSK